MGRLADLQTVLDQVVNAAADAGDIELLRDTGGVAARVVLAALNTVALLGTPEVLDAVRRVQSAATEVTSAAARWDAYRTPPLREEYDTARARFQQERAALVESGRASLL